MYVWAPPLEAGTIDKKIQYSGLDFFKQHI